MFLLGNMLFDSHFLWYLTVFDFSNTISECRGLTNFFCNGPRGKYFQLYRTWRLYLSQLCLSHLYFVGLLKSLDLSLSCCFSILSLYYPLYSPFMFSFCFIKCFMVFQVMGFFGGLDSKESACNAGDLSSVPGSGGSSREGNGCPLQYSCLENPMDRRVWQATVHELPKSRTPLSH